MRIIGINPAAKHPTFVEFDYEQIVNSHYEPLYRFAFSLTRNESDACDLTQDTFYTLATKGHQLRDKSKIKSWLFTALHRKFLGARRHNTRFPQCEIDETDQKLPTISSNTVNEMDGKLVWESLLMLDEIYRAPLLLFYLEDHSYQEIADTLELPPGTVMSRISRGKALLREQFNRTGSVRKIIPMDDKQFKKISPND